MAGAANDVVWLDVLPSMRGFGPALTKGVEKDAGDAGKKAGSAMSGRMKVALVAGAVAVGAAFSAALVSNINIGKANDKLAAQLGLSAKESGRIGKVAGDLYRDAYGESIEQVNDAVASVMSSIDGMSTASSAELESVTAKALDFAAAFEVDVSRAAQVAGQVVKTGLAGTADEAFDLLVASSQKVPAALREDLLDAVDEYGPSFAQLGFSGEQAFGLLVESSERGMYGIDKAGDALKEFTIRSTDMSKASQDAYGSIGLDAQTMSNDILAGGDKAAAATQKIVDGLLGIKDPSAQGAAAIALFGTPLEDLGTDNIPTFLASLDGTSDALGDVGGSAAKMGDTLNDNFATKMESWKRNAMGFAQDGLMRISKAGGAAFQWASEHKPAVIAMGIVLGTLTAGIVIYSATVRVVTAVTAAWNVVQKLLNGTMRLNPIGLIVTALSLLAAGLVIAYQKSDTFRAIVDRAWAGIRTAISFAWNSVIKPVFAALKYYISNVLVPVFSWLWNKIVKPIFGWIGRRISDVWNGVIKPVFGALRGGVGKIAEAFGATKDKIKSVWDKISGVIQGPIDKAIGIIDGFIGLINKIPGVKIDYIGGRGKAAPSATNRNKYGGKTKFATGGAVLGPGSGTSDSITARLSNGEHVLTAADVKALGGQAGVYAMRAAAQAGQFHMPGFAAGGAVVPGRGNQHSRAQYPWATYAGDFPVGMGTPVHAWKSGVIALVRSLTTSYGKHIRMNHDDGTSSLYAHLSSFAASQGDKVRQGGIIGRTGSTGNSTGPHLHFESMGGAFSGGGGGLLSKVASVWDTLKGAEGKIGGWIKSKLLDKANIGGLLGNVSGLFSKIGNGVKGYVTDKLFDNGGMLMPGQTGTNLSNRPEPVFTGRQWDTLSQAIRPQLSSRPVDVGARGNDLPPIQITMPASSGPGDVAEEILFAARRARRGGVYASA